MRHLKTTTKHKINFEREVETGESQLALVIYLNNMPPSKKSLKSRNHWRLPLRPGKLSSRFLCEHLYFSLRTWKFRPERGQGNGPSLGLTTPSSLLFFLTFFLPPKWRNHFLTSNHLAGQLWGVRTYNSFGKCATALQQCEEIMRENRPYLKPSKVTKGSTTPGRLGILECSMHVCC